MLDSTDVVEKKFNKETQRAVGEVQLKQYQQFLKKYYQDIQKFSKKLNTLIDVNAKPISLQIKPVENVTLMQLVHSDNKLLSRILLSLASVCKEINTLVSEAEANFYDSFAYYGEENPADSFEQLEKLFQLLQEVHFFIKRAQEVIILTLQQLCGILGHGFYSGSKTTSFPEPLKCVGELLVVLITLDSLLDTATVKEQWKIYRRAVRSMSHNPTQYNVSHISIRTLDKKLVEMEAELLTGSILQSSIEKCLLDESLSLAIKSCSISNEILLFINQILNEVDEISFTQVWIQANALTVFHYNLNGHLDGKLFKKLLEVNKKISTCTILGNIMWYPEQFLLKNIPTTNKHLDLKLIKAHRSSQLTQRSQNFSKETHQLCIQACNWIIEVEKLKNLDMNCLKNKQLEETCSLLIDGVKLVEKISEYIKWITNLHADEDKPMTKSILLALCKLVEVLKCFQFVFVRNILPLSYIISLISQVLTRKALSDLASVKKNITQGKTYKEQQLDVLSAVVVAERALKGPNTNDRILVLKLALSASGLSNETHTQLNTMRSVINKLEFILNSTHLINKLSNCSFLYWHQVLFPVYFSKLVDSRADLTKCHLLLASLTDCNSVRPTVKPALERLIQTNILTPLNQNVEANLRLQTHLHLQLSPSNPFQFFLPRTFKKINPLIFGDTYVNMKHEVEHYLSTMFYNLTTVVLHDWRTYGEMRRLAVLQYGLNTVEDNLPVQTLEQGLDVLEIMRNINVFVGKYLYNLNSQVFIEEWSSSKHLNTINISHVANSIRTHGIGIMSTTVNFTYQFLQKQFFTFSQFMFDEHIKSRLLKDLRFFTEHKVQLNQLYPYSRAEKFNYGIRKLGLNESGLSYLDLFRKLITQIGNAMGYVRLIRAGGKRCVADATCFLPDLKAVIDLNTIIDETDLPNLTKQAANCLKRDIKNLVDNFEEGTEYFKLLIKVFAPTFRDPQNIHLRNFYMIVPPLTINFIEHSLTSKERLNKINRESAAFTDDGFAIGLAYIIELLDQGRQLDSLHWFQSVNEKQCNDIKDLNSQQSKSSKDDVKLQQTLSLTEKRIKAINTEFKLLYYSFSSAKIFFQA